MPHGSPGRRALTESCIEHHRLHNNNPTDGLYCSTWTADQPPLLPRDTSVVHTELFFFSFLKQARHLCKQFTGTAVSASGECVLWAGGVNTRNR